MKISILFLSLVITVSMYGQADFSGNWKLNSDKSQFNNTPGSPGATRLVVVEKGETISVQRDNLEKETLKIDNTSEIEINAAGVQGAKAKISMKPSIDKQGLIETRTYIYPEGHTGVVAARKIRTWALSPDKKTLTIRDRIETTKERLEYDMLVIYDRQ
jgi:hypothetical protein